MRFTYAQSYWPQPQNAEQFLRPGRVEVFVPSTADIGPGDHAFPEEILGARLTVDHLDLYRGHNAGESLFDICDAEPSGWGEVYFALFDEQGELRESIIKEPAIGSILFLSQAAFHPALNEWRSFVVGHIAELFPVESLLMMRNATLDLSTKELARLGFHRIASSDLIVRESMLEHPYDVLKESKRAHEVRLPRSDKAVVNQMWERPLIHSEGQVREIG